MLRNTLCRSFILVLVVLAFALTPTIAQAAPRAADGTTAAWDVMGVLHQIWDIVWGNDTGGASIDPGVLAPIASPPAVAAGNLGSAANRPDRGKVAAVTRPAPGRG